MKEPETLTLHHLTFANVDRPDDKWSWCVVTDYEGHPQEYGEVVVAFDEAFLPDQAQVRAILHALLCLDKTECVTCGHDFNRHQHEVDNFLHHGWSSSDVCSNFKPKRPPRRLPGEVPIVVVIET